MKIIKAFVHAFKGIAYALQHELNFKIQLIAALMVILLGFYFGISTTEWLFVIGSCTIVLCLELMNTAIEKTCDLVTTKFHPAIKIIKDIAAGAVLMSAIGAAITGLVIFLPKIIHLIKSLP